MLTASFALALLALLPQTFEDFYGDTGDSFKAAIGLLNFEKAAMADPDPAAGFGLTIDDVLVEWKEFTLIADGSECLSGGQCAAIDLATQNFFEGQGTIQVTLLDRFGIAAANDCDQDGDNSSPGDDNDCDDDGVRDVVLRATSGSDIAGDLFVVNESSVGSGIFKQAIPISASYEAPGVVFVQPSGETNPVVTVQSVDWDDGTGSRCMNSINPANQGIVSASTTVFLASGDLVLSGVILTDNGDSDGWADTFETVDLQIAVSNKTELALTNVIGRLSSNDPAIDCVLDTFVAVGDIPAGESRWSSGTFRFRVADVDRSTLGLTEVDMLTADLSVILSADQVDAARAPQIVTLDLDLDAVGGGAPTTFFEGFEVAAGFGQFTTMNLDFGSDGTATGTHAEGYRCQYNDPDWLIGNSYGVLTCGIGSSPAAADAFYWQVHQTSDIDGGRAYSGERSLYYGIFGAAADEHTTPLSILEAVRTQSPIALGYAGSPPRLSFKHQVSLMDWRTVNTGPGRSADRAVVHLQLATPVGTPVGDWIKIYPEINIYDSQAWDQYTNCMYDPIDDGNGEEDFFDPSDPMRLLGPSSTCFPEFSFTYVGDTYSPYSPGLLGQASDGPGLPGALGIGTWVESVFNLQRFRGRNVYLRFLTTALDNGGSYSYQGVFNHNPDPGDDGWWIDDVAITDVLTSPATVSVDDIDNSSLPDCGAGCSSVSAVLGATPAEALVAPGSVVELDLLDSTADSCVDGVLQFRFWEDQDADGQVGAANDKLLRDWTNDALIVAAPTQSTAYVGEVRCSTAPGCNGSAARLVAVNCPASGALGGFPAVTATSPATLEWGTAIDAEFTSGELSTVNSYATHASGALIGASSFDISSDLPAVGQGDWYLFRGPGVLGSGSYCNDTTTWDAGGAPARDGALP